MYAKQTAIQEFRGCLSISVSFMTYCMAPGFKRAKVCLNLHSLCNTSLSVPKGMLNDTANNRKWNSTERIRRLWNEHSAQHAINNSTSSDHHSRCSAIVSKYIYISGAYKVNNVLWFAPVELQIEYDNSVVQLSIMTQKGNANVNPECTSSNWSANTSFKFNLTNELTMNRGVGLSRIPLNSKLYPSFLCAVKHIAL